MFKCQSQKLTSGMLSYIFCYPSEIYFRITILSIMEINNSLLLVQRTVSTDCNRQTSENIEWHYFYTSQVPVFLNFAFHCSSLNLVQSIKTIFLNAQLFFFISRDFILRCFALLVCFMEDRHQS